MKMKFNKYFLLPLVLLSIIIVTCTENHVLPNFASLRITSDPIGAEVFLDDQKRGVTPLELDEILGGSYTIILKQSEFEDTTITVDINDNQEMNFDIFMQESNPNGEISLTSDPSGASIFINNISTGKKTPSSITNLKRGAYDISLRLNLYENSNFQIDLSKDEKVERNTNMVIASSAGSMVITSDPVGASIFVDDVNTGKVTPSTIKPLSTGEHAVKLTLSEYIDSTFTIQVNQSQELNIDVFMRQQNPNGEITLTSQPSGASIFVNDINTEMVTPTTISNLERGNYDITLKLDLYEDENFQIELGKDEKIEKNTEFTISSIAGGLFVSSVPIGASIFVDNINTGKTTPDTIRPLLPGQHNVKLLLEDYKDSTFVVNVPSGEVISKSIILKALFIINVSVNPTNSGTITGDGGYVQGDMATLEAIPSEGYNFVNWTENGNEVSSNSEYNFVVNNNRDLVANFELKEYQINATTNPFNAGIITGSGIYKHGAEVTLVTSVNNGFSFVNWTDNSTEIGNETSVTFTANKDRNLVANFITIGNLTVNSDPTGAQIFLNNTFSGQVTPFDFQSLETGEYSVTLKLEDFADTTLVTDIFTGQTTDLGKVVLRDITPDVEVEISHRVNTDNQIIFSFIFNQDIRFSNLVARTPSGSSFPQQYGGVLLLQGVAIDWIYPEKLVGNWQFVFNGNKVDGRGNSFSIGKTEPVE